MVDKTLRMNLLFDFYGQLLTERQRHFFQLYYADDLSLGEIADESGVSRQAVYDIVKRAAAALENFESRLKLYIKYEKRARALEQCHELVQRLDEFLVRNNQLTRQDEAWLGTFRSELGQALSHILDAEE